MKAKKTEFAKTEKKYQLKILEGDKTNLLQYIGWCFITKSLQ